MPARKVASVEARRAAVLARWKRLVKDGWLRDVDYAAVEVLMSGLLDESDRKSHEVLARVVELLSADPRFLRALEQALDESEAMRTRCRLEDERIERERQSEVA